MGHVPKSPSYREVEFEGLLRSNGSKILSLNKPGASGSTGAMSPIIGGIHSPTTTDEQSTTPHPPSATQLTVTISTPLYAPSREETDNDKPPAPPAKDKNRDSKLDRSTYDSPISPSRKLASRFRVHPTFRRSGFVPAEYAEATVDFETRLASYSDDELNNASSTGERDKDERRRSRDDAWVDILVATHNRRMDGDLRQRGARGKVMQDPMIASLEVAQVLAGVERARSPMSDNELEAIPAPAAAPSMKSGDVDVDADVDSVMSYPKTVTSSAKKRVGYFDLHPERRPPRSPQPTSLGEDSDADEELRYGSPEMSTPSKYSIPANTSPTAFPEPLRSSIDTEASSYAPTSTNSLQGDVLDFAYEDCAANGIESVHLQMGSMVISQPVATEPVTPEKGEKERSRTAALIEMYREREKKSSVTTPAPIPKLPVRSTSLPTRDREAALPPVPVVRPEPIVVTPAKEIVEEPVVTIGSQGAEFLQPVNLMYDGSGRDSPGRYVHGAPLHNVLEEEEEE